MNPKYERQPSRDDARRAVNQLISDATEFACVGLHVPVDKAPGVNVFGVFAVSRDGHRVIMQHSLRDYAKRWGDVALADTLVDAAVQNNFAQILLSTLQRWTASHSQEQTNTDTTKEEEHFDVSSN